jgi:hypothetical protein
LGQSTLVVLCAGSTLQLVQSYAPDKALYINCLEQSPSQQASTFGSWFFLLLVRLNLGFILREDLSLCLSYLPLGVPNWAASTAIKQFFWRRCREERGFLQGESLASNLFYFVIVLLIFFTFFLLASFYQKYKKIASFIIGISLLLLLVHYVVP